MHVSIDVQMEQFFLVLRIKIYTLEKTLQSTLLGVGDCHDASSQRLYHHGEIVGIPLEIHQVEKFEEWIKKYFRF